MKKKIALGVGVILLVLYGMVALAGIYSLASCRDIALPENSTVSYGDCGDMNRGWFALYLVLSPLVLVGSGLVLVGLRRHQSKFGSLFMRTLAVAAGLVGLLLVGVVLTATQAAIRSWFWPTAMDIYSRPDLKQAAIATTFFIVMAIVGAVILFFARRLWQESKTA